MRKALQFFAVIVLVAACGSGDEVAVEEVAPATAPAPTPEDHNEANSELEPVEVELNALLSADGDTVTVVGTTNLPDGAGLIWALAERVETPSSPASMSLARRLLVWVLPERFASSVRPPPELTWRDVGGAVLQGNVTVRDGSYHFDLSESSWAELDLCVAPSLELWVAYWPQADIAGPDGLPEQPGELYELHGENGERIPGAAAPAELLERSSGGRSVQLLVRCP